MADDKDPDDRELREMVQKGRWVCLARCLQHQTLRHTQLTWAVQAASETANAAELAILIPHVPDSHLPHVLTETVKRGLWSAVAQLMRRALPTQQRQWAASGASKRASGPDLENILLCHAALEHELSDATLSHLVTRDQWAVLRRLVPDHVTASQRDWVLREACRRAEEQHVHGFLPHCPPHLLDNVLAQVTDRQLWGAVAELLPLPVSERTRRRAVSEATSRAGDSHFGVIARHCADDQLPVVLGAAVARRMWGVTEELLGRETDRARIQWAVLHAIQDEADENLLCRLVDEYCDVMTLGPLLSEAVRRGLWQCVGELLKHRVPGARRRWAVEEASQRAPESLLLPLLRHCHDRQLHAVVTHVVIRRLWDCVIDLLRRPVSHLTSSWALREASSQAGEDTLRPLLRFCTDDVFPDVLTNAVRRGLWRVVVQLLKGPRDTQCVTASMEQVSATLATEFDTVLRKAVQTQSWTVVGLILQLWAVSGAGRRWAVGKVCRAALYRLHVTDAQFADIVLRHCDVTQLPLALEAASRRDMSRAVSRILTRIGRHGDPLTVTPDGRTVLLVVMETRTRRRQLVAECLHLGLGTHQPDVTDFHVAACREPGTRPAILSLPGSSSPLERAAIANDVTVARMLYESGSCSNREVYRLHRHFRHWHSHSQKFRAMFSAMSQYLDSRAASPRRLISLSRLVISHRLGVGSTRHDRARQLPLPDTLKDYVIFSDLTDIDSGDASSSDVIRDNDAACDWNDLKDIACELQDY